MTRQRDEWRDKFHALNQTAGELCNACGWAFKIPGESCRCEVIKERDEARAKLYEMNLKLNQAYTDAERLQKERDAAIARITEVGVMVARGLGDMEKYAYKRGAEAMREACATKVVEWLDHRWATALWLDKLIRELPIPEEP